MEKIYLVKNIASLDEDWVLDICTSEEEAVRLRNQYRENFIIGGYTESEANDIIVTEEVDLDENKKVIWRYD